MNVFSKEYELVFPPTKNNNVLIFIDLNASNLEREAAIKGARELGLGFAIIPSLKTAKKLSVPYEKWLNCQDKIDNLNINDPNYDVKKKYLNDKSDMLDNECTLIVEKLGEIDPINELISLTNDIKKMKFHVTHFAISGHHGRGLFNGDYYCKEDIDLDDIYSKFNETPEVYDKLKHLFLWGCNTIDHDKIANALLQFPHFKSIHGYYDYAPLGTRPASANFLYDAIKYSEDLINSKTSSELLQKIKKLNNINYIYAGVFTRLMDGNSYLYYNSDNSNDLNAISIQQNFESMTEVVRKTACERFIEKRFNLLQEKISNYYFGEILNNSNETTTELRNIYFEMNQNYDCYKDSKELVRAPYLHPSTIGLLRFFTNVKLNFLNSFKAEIMNAENEISSLRSDKILYQTFETVFPISIIETIKTSSRKQIINMLNIFKNIFTNNKNKFLKLRLINLLSLEMILERYLINLDHTCMSFLEWHSASRTNLTTPTAKCILQINNEGELIWGDELNHNLYLPNLSITNGLLPEFN